jgi:hypothetical protein
LLRGIEGQMITPERRAGAKAATLKRRAMSRDPPGVAATIPLRIVTPERISATRHNYLKFNNFNINMAKPLRIVTALPSPTQRYSTQNII